MAGFDYSSSASSGSLDVTKAAATDDVVTLDVTGDTNDRFVINADGRLEWGSGSGAADVALYRSAADLLRTPDSLRVDGKLGVNKEGGGVGMFEIESLVNHEGINVIAASNASALHIKSSVGASMFRVRQDGGVTMDSGAYAGATNTGGTLSFGTGAPNNANGSNGDIYFRVDGGASTTIYQRRAGAWVGIA